MGRVKLVEQSGRYHLWVVANLLSPFSILCLLIALSTCGTNQANSPEVPTDGTAQAPTVAELSDLLLAELARLGKDASKIAAAAPSGSDNAVFDLSAVILDDGNGGGVSAAGFVGATPASPTTTGSRESHSRTAGNDGEKVSPLPGEAGLAPTKNISATTGIELSWTERIIGDYDQNGEVNLSDITPLVLNWGNNVAYDDPALHGGFDRWPTGDPDGAGADNWRKAQIDGDGNGEINTSDITPIALHFQERIDGYRVYRKGPEEPHFSLVGEVSRSGFTGGDLIQYKFIDQPPSEGEIEYYVIAYSTNEGQAAAPSVAASVVLGVGFSDTTPPVWSDTAGIISVGDNADNTVKVQWGIAVDESSPPSPSSPPVTYNVYYSTASPVDFDAASRIELAQSPWVSPPLIAGQTYFFAVRAQDSASPPNVELNAEEMSVTVTGSTTIEDLDPPIWIELDGNNDRIIKGIKEFEVLDGVLRITRADAYDELSPPVHYDLYYISDHLASSVLIQEGENEGDPRPDAQIVYDIPPVYDLVWPNREGVHFHIRARDSNPSTNQETNDFERVGAPISIDKVIMDMQFPGLDPARLTRLDLEVAYDSFNHKFYAVYQARHDLEWENELWFIEIDADTGVWTSRQLYSAPPGETLNSSHTINRSWTGDIWISWAKKPDGGSTEIVYDILRANGGWERWDIDDPPGTLVGKLFDHNGNPVTLEAAPSDVQENRFKILYPWWNEESREWITETVHDPGGPQCQSYTRPDGTLQLIMYGEARFPGDPLPKVTRLLERAPDGTWTLVLEGEGGIGAYDYPATWGEAVEWSGSTSIRTGTNEDFIYNSSGYSFFPEPTYRNDEPVWGRMWPDGEGGYHYLPEYLNSESGYRKQYLYSKDYSQAVADPEYTKTLRGQFRFFLFNPLDEFFAHVFIAPNLTTRQYELVLHKVPAGGSLFRP